MSYDYAFKIVVVGDQGVGKTALLDRIVHDKYDRKQQMPTIGVEFQAKMIELEDGKIVKCQLWDTAGQEAFAPIIKTYFRGSAGALLCFSLSETDAMERIIHWHRELITHVPKYCKFILVGTKFDEGPICEIEEITDYANEHDMEYVFCSSLTSYRCNEILYKICRKIYMDKDFDKKKSKTGIKVIDLSETEEERITKEMTELYCTKCVIN